MKLVVDTNVVISAIIRDSTARELLFHPSLKLYAPAYMFEELNRNKEEIMQKAGIDEKDFEAFLRIVAKVVIILTKEAYIEYVSEVNVIIQYANDAPFAALAVALGDCGIWTNDPHFIRKESELLQKFGIQVWTIKSLHELMKE